MKILHIGNKKNMEMYSPKNDLYKSSEIIEMDLNASSKECLEKARDAQVIVCDAIAKVDQELIEGMPNLKMIHSEGVAYNLIDLQAASKQNVSVCNCASMNASAVAEQTIYLMLACIKNGIKNHQAVLNGKQMDIKMNYMQEANLMELSDFKIGLIGFGDIGKEVAKRLNGFGCDVYCTKRSPLTQAEQEEYNVTYLSQEDLLKTCSMISLHLPVNSETEHMCNSSFFMGCNHTIFINTSRGELVEDEALLNALKNHQIEMAGIDTLDMEPVKKDHPVLSWPSEILDRVILSPHIGGITRSSFQRGYQMIWENIARLNEEQSLKRVVNKI